MFDLVLKEEVVEVKETIVPMTLECYVGAKIAEAREKKGERVAQFVRNLRDEIDFEISETTVHKIEKGETFIRLNDLYEISNYFKMDMGDFIPEKALFPWRTAFEATKLISVE